jgi:hypothetical protein
MRSHKLLATVLIFSTVIRPSAVVAEPTYTVNDTINDTKVVEMIKATIDTFSLPTKEEVAEKEIREYVKKIEAEKRKVASAKAKAKVKATTTKKVAVRVASVATSSVTVPGSNACVIAMKKVFPKNLWTIGYAIMRAESGARTNAIGGPNYNGTYDYGCWQINNTPRALDPLTGAKIAMYKYNHSGWYPWTVYKTGAYLRYF